MKGAVEELVAKLHAGHLEFIPGDHPAFASGACLKVKLNGKEIGVMGAVSAKMRHPFRLTTQMALCELETKLLTKNYDKLGRVSEVPQFPSVRRDVSIKPKAGVTDAEIVALIRKNGGRTLVGVELFDVFPALMRWSSVPMRRRLQTMRLEARSTRSWTPSSPFPNNHR